jgi:hypothetical protein
MEGDAALDPRRSNSGPPPSCRELPPIGLNVVVDAVNAIGNEAARRMAIAALKEREPSVRWLRRPDGYLDVAE